MKSHESRKLHLGCFDCPTEGWLNTDITPHLWIARIPLLPEFLHGLGKLDDRRYTQHREGIFKKVHYLNLSKVFPYANDRFEFVFSSHVFEHIRRPVLAKTLKEILRVMKSGGTMRVAVPNLSFFVSKYSEAEADEFVRSVFEMENGMEKNRHQWMYSRVSLAAFLKEAGFVNVRECQYREGRCPDLNLLDNRPDHSLFMEADKP